MRGLRRGGKEPSRAEHHHRRAALRFFAFYLPEKGVIPGVPAERELAQPVQRVRGGKRHAVVGPNQLRQPKLLERPLEDGEGEFLLGGRQGFAGEEVPTREVCDGERIAVAPITEHKLAFVVGAPQRVRRRRA